MKTTETIHYVLRINRNEASTSYLSPQGYSKYYERLRQYHDDKIKHDEVYGLDQAKEHAKEYFATEDQYTASRRKEILTIEKVTTINEPIESFKFPLV